MGSTIMPERQTSFRETKIIEPQVTKFSLTRRNFIKVALAAIVAGVLGPKSSRDELVFYARTGRNALFPQQDLDAARIDVEQKYDIVIDKNSWDIQQIQLLDTLLSELPKHFYDVSPSGQRLKLDIAQLSDCCAELPEGQRVQLAYYQFTSEDPRIAKQTLVHELTHRVTVKTSSEAPRAWANKLDTLLGSTFLTDVKQIVDAAFESQKSGRELRLDDETKEFYERIRDTQKRHWFTLGFEDPYASHSEFIAVLGERYINGKDYFYQKYGLLFDESQVNSLYTMVKNDIFRGMEYLNGSK